MELPEVRMSFPDRAALEREVEQNLRLGRAFLARPSELAVLSECALVLVHPEHGQELRLFAQVVMVLESGPMCGVGFQVRGCDAEQLARFVGSAPVPVPVPIDEVPGVDSAEARLETPPRTMQPLAAEHARVTTANGPAPAASELDPNCAASAGAMTIPPENASEPAGRLSREPGVDVSNALTMPPPNAGQELSEPSRSQRPTAPPSAAELLEPLSALAEDDPEGEAMFDETELPPEPAGASELQIGSRQEKLRHLNAAQQLKAARTGELADRITVERLYGKQVWAALLQNPRLTTPEVARIARKGSVPKPLLEMIMENAGWLKTDAVRRALLSNPKLGPDAVQKLLRTTPKHELKLIEKGTAYGQAVREAARKLLRAPGQ
jgi:hypothetical protein